MSIYQRRIACITGGTGFRFVAKALAALYPNPTTVHVIGTADSGRSTRQLRLFFDMPAIGDLRSRCIDLADRRSPGFSEITDLLAYRLPNKGNQAVLEQELSLILNGRHPLSKAALTGNFKFAKIILANLSRFDEKRKIIEQTKGPFDLREGSIGNFFLTGAYLDYGNIGAAIFLYEKLAGVHGLVLPASEETMHLAIETADHQVVVGQHVITKSELSSPIQRLFFLDHEDEKANEIHPKLSAEAAEAISGADMIVFSMGSFYTSILSSLHLMGMAEAVRKSHALKVFIPNTIEDPEIRGLTTVDMVKRLVSTLREQDAGVAGTNDNDYLQMVITGDHTRISDLEGGRRLIPNDIDGLKGAFRIDEPIPLIADGIQKGYYQPEPLANMLASLEL
jgi:CofD-related protein of GAK system